MGENMPLGQPPHMIVCNTAVLVSSRNAPPHKWCCVTTLKVGVNYAHDEWFPFVLKKIVSLDQGQFLYWPYCVRQEEAAILISRLVLRMRRMYVASILFNIRLDFH